MPERALLRQRVRLAQSDEAARLAELVAAAFAEVAARLGLTRENCPSHPSFADEAAIRRSLSYGTVFLRIPEDGAPSGCVGVRRPKDGICALEKLAVLPAARRHGTGRALVEAAAMVAVDWRATELEASIIASEHDLARWYDGLGFVPLRTARFPQLPFEVMVLRTGVGLGSLKPDSTYRESD
ncbi:MAG TPA: GNAT family N-acetyltransferase [Rhodopseudomonas sp.]|uniref:GNAT family N-acetyltransferase n=1 Tax=Rhodopseudomonas sp. TaxID=1078 RepID=UPI002EDB0038